jgi:hypothetical protein
VLPAQAGIQRDKIFKRWILWIPACAGMTWWTPRRKDEAARLVLDQSSGA